MPDAPRSACPTNPRRAAATGQRQRQRAAASGSAPAVRRRRVRAVSTGPNSAGRGIRQGIDRRRASRDYGPGLSPTPGGPASHCCAASPSGQGPCRGCCRQTGPHPRPRPPRTTVPGRDPRVTRLRSGGYSRRPSVHSHSATPGRSHTTAPGSRGPPPAHCGTRATLSSEASEPERADARTDAHRYVALSREPTA